MHNGAKRLGAAFLAAMTAFAAVGSFPQEADAMFGSTRPDTETVDIVIDTGKDRTRISSYIYGINDNVSASDVNVTAIKQTGLGISGYNWETNTANMGADGNYISSYDLVSAFSRNVFSTPALYTKMLIDKSELYDINNKFVTLQMMGYVANDGMGVVTAGESERWAEVKFKKGSDLLIYPDVDDGRVYMDEYVSYLVNSYGFASDGGVNGYFLDSEPESWLENYGFSGIGELTSAELLSKSAELADTVKSVDPTAIVLGPSVSGIEAYVNLKNENDWEQYKENYSWFIDYYLDNMNIVSEKKGKRLLDVLDLHFFTEARSVLLEPVISSDTKFANEERMQAVRVLWDSNYTENSSTAILYKQHTPLIPTIQASIRMYYPGTKLSFSEYDFGGGGDISGGIAQADVLGIFGREEVYMACLRPTGEDDSYQKAAIDLYTDYDGKDAAFGDISVYADNGGDIMSSVYASVESTDESALRAVLLNKNMTAEKPASIKITSDTAYHSARIYRLDGESAEVVYDGAVENIEDNTFDFTMSPLSAYMLEFSSSEVMQEEDVTTAEPEETEVTTVEEETEAMSETEVTEPEETAVSVTESAAVKTEEPTVFSEQVAAESSAAESISAESGAETDIAPPEESVSSVTEVTTVTSVSEAGQEPADESKVPAAVKVIVILLVAAVGAAVVYVIITDIILSHKKK